MNFEEELKKGNFVLGECTECKKTIWPPSEYCNRCFGTVEIRKGSPNGKIIEFSKQNEEDYFCLAEFEGTVKLMGKILSGVPKNNQNVKIKRCGIKDGNYFFEFSLV